jgi:hypothetical protein
MRKYIQSSLLLLLAGLSAGIAAAQSSPTPAAAPVKYYRADFLVKEVDATGHAVNSRSYSTILLTDNQNSPKQVRSGDRIPIRVTTADKGDIQYVDIGVNIDCRFVHELDQKLAMSVTAEISSLPAGADLSSSLDPLIRQFKWNADVLLTPGTPTTIFSSDDVGSKTKVQLEVTPTLIR